MAAMDPCEQCEQRESRTGGVAREGRLHYLPGALPQKRGPRWHNYTAFVLSGGGARGALQAGALRALLEYGIQPDAVVGTSIGSWNGSWLARNPSLEGARGLEDAWRGITPSQVLLGRDMPSSYPAAALHGFVLLSAAHRLARGRGSLYGGEGQRKLIEKFLGELTFEETAIPLRIAATDLTAGTRAIFRSGPVVPAVLASSAIPGIFPPVRIGGHYYCDGGSTDMCCIDAALQLGARRLFILAIGYDMEADGGDLWTGQAEEDDDESTTPRMASVLDRVAQVMGHHQLTRELARLPRGIEAHLIPLSGGKSTGMLDFNETEDFLRTGYETARDYLRSALGAEGEASSVG